MKRFPPLHVRWSWSKFIAVTTLLLAAFPCAAAEPSADELLQAVGMKHGLVVQVGATDGLLAETLAKSETLLVQVLVADATAEARLRQHFVKVGVHGQATVGRWSAAGSLPLAD
ncbi:MAG: hypothetical protein ACI9HK_003627, partial [Pirellulaceae bacterium]